MSRTNVEVIVPALGKRYEFVIPSAMKVGIAAGLITRAIREYEGLAGNEDSILLLGSKGRKDMLENNVSIERAGVRDGSELILI